MIWELKDVQETLKLQRENLQEKDEYIRSTSYSHNLTDTVKSRAKLIERMTALEEIRDEIIKCDELEDMNDYIAQKALVYTLIKKYTEPQR